MMVILPKCNLLGSQHQANCMQPQILISFIIGPCVWFHSSIMYQEKQKLPPQVILQLSNLSGPPAYAWCPLTIAMPILQWFLTLSVPEPVFWLGFFLCRLVLQPSQGHGCRNAAPYPMFPTNFPLAGLDCLDDSQFLLGLIPNPLHSVTHKTHVGVVCLP